MLSQVIAVLVTAVLSSALTVWLLQWVYENRIRDELEAEINSRLQAALAQFEEVLQERVRQGVVDGVSAIPSVEVLAGASRTMTDTAAEIVKGGLSAFLGGSDVGLGRSDEPEPDDE